MNRFSKVFYVAVLIFVLACAFVACNTDSQQAGDLGKYYLVENGELVQDSYIELKSGKKWTDGEFSGTYKLNGTAITLFDGDDELMSGTLSNGVLTLEFMGMESVYRKGTPGTNVDSNPSNPQNDEFLVQFFLNDGTTSSIRRETENQLITYTPTRSGYIFNGWWFSSGNTENGAPILTKRWNMEQKVEDDSLVLYAEWVFAPTEDAQLSAPSVSVDGYRYSWDSIAGASGYNVILKSGDEIIEEIKALQSTYWDFTQSYEAGTYTLEIRANGDGIKTINSSYTIKNISHKILGKLSSFSFDKKTATISWGFVEGATSYDVWCDGVCLLEDTAVKTYVLTNIDAGKRNVTIIAKREGWKTSYNYYEIEKDMLKTPSDVNAIFDYEDMTYTLSWDAVKGIAGSEIVYKIFNGSEFITQTDKTTYVVQKSDWGTTETVKNIQVVSFDTSANTIQSIPSDKIELKKMVEIEFLPNDAAAGTVKAKRIVNDINITFNYNYKDCPKDVVQVLNESNRGIKYFEPQRNGYVFLGWFRDKAGSKRFDFASTVSEDTTLYALWQDIGDNTSVFKINEEKHIYTETTLKKYAFVPMKGGDFTFYFKNESGMRTNISISQGINKIYSPMYQTATSLTEKTISLEAYQVVIIGVQATSENYRGYFTFGLNGDALPDCNPNNFAQGSAENKIIAPVGTEIELTAITNLGYSWRGWYNGNVKVSDDTNLIYRFSVPSTYKKYIAKWYMNTEMSAFDFTSTPTSCTIRGLKDKTTTDIVIPEYVTSIYDDGFSGCADITSISGHIDMIGIVIKQANPTSFSANITSGTTIGDYLFRYSGLASVTIGNSVTSIGQEAFYGCTSLTSVTIPNSVTSIGASAFYGCTSLTSITIGNSVTSIGDEAFSGCTGLTSISVDTENQKYNSEGNCLIENVSKTLVLGCKNSIIPTDGSVTSIGPSAFYNCSDLTRITIPDSVTSIRANAFEECTGLTSVTIPDSVTSIYYHAFYGSGLTSVTIPTSVTSIGPSAFERCSRLTSIVIPNSVTSIGVDAFRRCTGLTSISGSAKMVSVVAKQASPIAFVANITSGNSIEASAFSNCSGLTSVMIGNSVTSIGSNAFYGCIGLTSIYYTGDIAGWCGISGLGNLMSSSRTLYIGGKKVEGELAISDGVTSIGSYAFRGCTGLTSVTIPDSVTNIGDYAFDGCTGLTSVNIPNSVTSTGRCAFEDCTGLTSITIPEGVTSIGVSSFSGCRGLISVTIPDGVTNIGDAAFSRCTGLTSVTIPDSVTNICDSAFSSCSGLTSITIPDSVTSIGNRAFYGCTGLTSINGSAKMVSVVANQASPISFVANITSGDNIGLSAFSGRGGLTSITIPDSVTSIGDSAFSNCTGLTSIYYTGDIAGWCGIIGLDNLMSSSRTLYIGGKKVEGELIIPDSVTSIGSFAFGGCTRLTSVTIPDSVTSIDSSAFSGCTGLTSIIIPDSVTSIGDSAFSNCTGLTSITIPDSVTSIGRFAFEECIGLTSINGSAEMVSVVAKQASPISFVANITSGNSIEASAFYGCTGLTSINIPNSVTSIGEYAFSNCRGLTSVTIPNSVTSIGDHAFFACLRLIEVYNKSSFTITAGSSNNGYVAYYAKNVYTAEGGSKLSMDDNGYVIYTDGAKKILVSYNGNETELTLPFGITQINQYAFYYCTGLTSVTIPDSVTSIGYSAFSCCTGLTSVTIGSSVTSIGYDAFYGCSGLTSINIPNSVTSIGEYAFSNCRGLKSISGSAETVSVVAKQAKPTLFVVNITSGNSIDASAFYGCTGLTSINIPNSVTSIGVSAFSGCRGLTSVTIPNSVTSIGDHAFYACYKLVEVYNKSSLTITAGSSNNGYVAYYAKNVYTAEGGSKLSMDDNGYVIYTDGAEKILVAYTGTETELVLPSNITQINQGSFYGCTGLTSVTIGSGVTSIGSYAFSGCTGLTRINFQGTKGQWNAISKGDGWDSNTGTYTIYCTNGNISKS